MRIPAALAVAGLVAVGSPAVAAAAPQAQCANPSGTYSGAVPWGQRQIDPSRIWPLTRGDGQLVAVIGTGVDGQNRQFAPGQLEGGAGTESADCDGRGTIAAGIVGAQPDPSTTFAGVAPGARLLPIRYTDSSSRDGGDPGALAGAIDTALDRHAGVILIAVPAAFDSPALSGAVSRARSEGAVVVSAASATQQGARTYPTATSGVLGVGSVNQAGEPVQTEAGDYVGVAAPGAELVSTSAGAGGAIAHRWPVTDPGLAAAYVAGVAALVRAYHPDLTGDQVATRLTLTAHRPASGGHDPRLGWGVLDAYAAVSSTLPADIAPPGSAAPAATEPDVVPAAAPARHPSDVPAATIALAGVALAAAAGVTVAAVRRARRRGWRPSRFTP
ncbi:S8 family serine peptidase [Amycolatopsis sp. FBCC-B4732]|uniref:S8 family serine peptidase n=1 Tax=Amycolatopsis sp. FBCC-B4732 TaxID=3079339 RepID=UPI001FF19AB1|nr:S8 family serine peptidase [Amycolatopsis sp. FBCC-B4732]UOX85119.1 S8 family serine peptidase [Amycolatopsis sp. FBCC-B4732]